ncbi:hypothetical protein [uncultured Gammaproteobacteria bacterium]|jgi:hypothetical protein|nr:hypothetical protein [uncultured Gammaproteobacteria bacterium]CAC9956018.1 hypothetical protein [uncultured Gammaproteobacteria bacterium]
MNIPRAESNRLGNKYTLPSLTNADNLAVSKPMLTITGSGGSNTAANTIVFNFSKAIKDEAFDIDDIDIVNGTINFGSFTRVSETQYTIVVTPNLSGKHSNVAITITENTLERITNVASNISTAKNITNIVNSQDIVDFDLTNWDVSHVNNASRAFFHATTFNQDIGNWDVSKVIIMREMFFNAKTFNQDVGSWDISSLKNAKDMFYNSAMSIDNMDNTLRDWAKLDTAAGETAIQSNVEWGITNYTDATAKQYLIDTYNWTINGGIFDDSKTVQGTNLRDTLLTQLSNNSPIKNTLHGLGGDDFMIGFEEDSVFIGGAGCDTMIGGGGKDTFVFKYANAQDDIVCGFTVGDTRTNAEADIVDLSDLLIGYKSANLSDFVTVAASSKAGDTKMTVDHDGAGALHSLVTIELVDIAYSANLLSDMVNYGNLVLE